MKPLLLLVVYIFNTSIGYSQTKEICDPWRNVVMRNNMPDTLKIKVKLWSLDANVFNMTGTKYYPPGFYGKLLRKYDMPLALSVRLVDCDSLVGYPFIYKSKYDYTLFPRKNKQGKLENWKEGQLLEITCVRFNHYFGSSFYSDRANQLVTIIIDIKALEEPAQRTGQNQ